jgi:hypothetical protein
MALLLFPSTDFKLQCQPEEGQYDHNVIKGGYTGGAPGVRAPPPHVSKMFYPFFFYTFIILN